MAGSAGRGRAVPREMRALRPLLPVPRGPRCRGFRRAGADAARVGDLYAQRAVGHHLGAAQHDTQRVHPHPGWTDGLEHTNASEFAHCFLFFLVSQGTKVMCAEGGCGACVVTIETTDAATNTTTAASANSCLRLLGSVDGQSVTTIEALGR